MKIYYIYFSFGVIILNYVKNKQAKYRAKAHFQLTYHGCGNKSPVYSVFWIRNTNFLKEAQFIKKLLNARLSDIHILLLFLFYETLPFLWKRTRKLKAIAKALALLKREVTWPSPSARTTFEFFHISVQDHHWKVLIKMCPLYPFHVIILYLCLLLPLLFAVIEGSEELAAALRFHPKKIEKLLQYNSTEIELSCENCDKFDTNKDWQVRISNQEQHEHIASIQVQVSIKD